MTTSNHPVARPGGIALAPMLLAGCAATIAFDLFGQALTPLLGFARLSPVGLATSTIQSLFGMKINGGGDLLHYIAGLVAYPIGWLLIARPVARKILPKMPDLLVATAYGIGLWVFALFIMAHLVAGLPPFLNFTGITWVALLGHILFAVVFARVYDWLCARGADR